MEFNEQELSGKRKGTIQAEGTVRAKAKMRKHGRECVGNKSIWNFHDKVKTDR